MSDDPQAYLVDPGPKPSPSGLRAAVSTDSAIVTETMVNVLRSGGNAADAAVAGALVQAAVQPHLTNHAGLVSFLYYEAKTGLFHQLDGSGTFPSGLAPFKPVPAGTGPFAVVPPSAVIPGFMPALKEIHRRFCSLPWAELCTDALRWAEQGHPVSTFEYGTYVFADRFITYFPEGRDFFQPQGRFPSVGEVMVPRGLADTLRGVAEDGPDHMISGPWAEQFVARANEMGWAIRLEHMAETPPRWVEPLRFPHRDAEIVSLGPPQAQGLFIGVALGVLKHLGIRDVEPGSAEHYWMMGHALRQATRHWEYAQDDAVYGVPRDEVLEDAYHAHLATMIHASRPRVDLSEHVRLAADAGAEIFAAFTAGGGRPRSAKPDADRPTGSCEIAVVDAAGNWVQMMDTLQASGIPGMVVGGVPMVGSHATFGALQSGIDATLVRGARPRNCVGSTFVVREGRPVLSLGTPGNVHCTIPQVLACVLDLGLDPVAAVDAPRMLPMTEGREVTVEDRLTPDALAGLHRLGVRVSVVHGYDQHMGSFAVIARDEADGTYTAVADPRRCAVAAGLR